MNLSPLMNFYNGYTQAEYFAIRENPGLWFETHGRILNKQRQEITPKANVVQRRTNTEYLKAQAAQRACHLSGVKKRQGAFTTCGTAMAYSHCMNYVTRFGLIGTGHPVSANMWHMVDYFRRRDTFYKAKLKTIGGSHLESRLHWEHDSRMDCYTADNPESARSATLQGYHASEVGRWPNGGANDAAKTIQAMRGAVPKQGFTFRLEESTPQGAYGIHYETFIQARWPEGETWWKKWESDLPQNPKSFGEDVQIYRIFAAWFEFEDSVMDLTDAERKHIQKTKDEKEDLLLMRYGNTGPSGQLRLGEEVDKVMILSNGVYKEVVVDAWMQLAYRRSLIATDCGDEDTFDQEFPSDPRSCFLASGRPRFNQTSLTRMISTARSRPPSDARIDQQPSGELQLLRVKQEATLDLWELPVIGCRYLMPVDLSTGADVNAALSKKEDGVRVDPDSHSVGIIRAGYIDAAGRQWKPRLAARIKTPLGDNWAMPVLARHAAVLSRFYGRCPCVFEIQGPGQRFMELMRPLGIPLYQRMSRPDKATSIETGYEGVHMSTDLRISIIDELATQIRNLSVDIDCLHSLTQCGTFVIGKDGIARGAPGKHDDDVMMLGMGLYFLPIATKYTGLKPSKTKGPGQYQSTERSTKGNPLFPS